jgi:uncharacterized protein with PQ loop repeat
VSSHCVCSYHITVSSQSVCSVRLQCHHNLYAPVIKCHRICMHLSLNVITISMYLSDYSVITLCMFLSYYSVITICVPYQIKMSSQSVCCVRLQCHHNLYAPVIKCHRICMHLSLNVITLCTHLSHYSGVTICNHITRCTLSS